MDNIVRDIKATLYERVTNPFFGIFFLWWFVINFDFVLIVTGHSATLDALRSYYGYTTCLNGKFSSILCLCSEINAKLTYHWYLAIYSIILPFIMTFFTTYVLYPIIAKTIYQKHSEELSKLKSIKKKIENAELLTMEESQKIRSLHKTLEVERDSLRQQLQSHIDMTNSNKRSHETIVESKESEIKRLKNDIENVKKEKQDLQSKKQKEYNPLDYIDEILESDSIQDFVNFYEAFIVNESKINQKYKSRTGNNSIEIDNYDTLHNNLMNNNQFIIFLSRYELGKIVRYNSSDNPPIIDLNKELCTPLYREIKKRSTEK